MGISLSRLLQDSTTVSVGMRWLSWSRRFRFLACVCYHQLCSRVLNRLHITSSPTLPTSYITLVTEEWINLVEFRLLVACNALLSRHYSLRHVLRRTVNFDQKRLSTAGKSNNFVVKSWKINYQRRSPVHLRYINNIASMHNSVGSSDYNSLTT